jgi:hypothetical protein
MKPTMSELLNELTIAFPPQPLTPDLFVDPSGLWATYDDGGQFEAGSRQRTWNELAPAFVEQNCGALRYMKPKTFAAFVPAYLASLVRGDTQNELPELVLTQLTREQGWEHKFDERAVLLTDQQRITIANVLDALAHGERFEHLRREIATALSSWR